MSTGQEDRIRALLRDAVATIQTEAPDPNRIRDTAAGVQPVKVTHMRPGQWLAIAAAAAAIIAVAAGTVLIGRQSHSRPGSNVAAGSSSPSAQSSSATSTPSIATTSPSGGSGGVPGCTGTELAASVDRARTGPANGTQNVVILLHNSSATACHLGGLVSLSGVTDAGNVVPLGFRASLDPGVADPSPATGPGTVRPGTDGALHLTLALNNCAAPSAHYARLRIRLVSGSLVTMPFPPELAVTGCYGYAAQPGPVASQ